MATARRLGRRGGAWIPDAELLALYDEGRTHDEIANIVAERNGAAWRPTKGGVKRKLDRLGAAPRNTSHKALLPWQVAPEHHSDVLRHALAAESRKRQGVELSDADERLIRSLYMKLEGGRRVVTYDPESGFRLVPRQPYDRDIIRDPRADTYSADALP